MIYYNRRKQMTTHIPKHHVNRLFTYDFFKSLDQTLHTHVVMNPVFLAQDTKQEARMQKNAEQRFQKAWDRIYPGVVEKNNLHTFEQGTFLIVHPYVKREDHKKALKGKAVPKWMLLAQWLDVDGNPSFDHESSMEHINELPNMSLTDPHLALAFMETVRDKDTKEVNSTLQVIKGPESWLETIQGPWEQLDLTTPEKDTD